MTSKIRAIISAVAAAFCEFVRYLTTLPPEQQVGALQQLVDIFPVAWRPQLSLWSTVIARSLAFYAVYSAAHSGPSTPPKNPPSQ